MSSKNARCDNAHWGHTLRRLRAAAEPLRPAELAGLLRFEFDHSGKAEIEDELLRDYASGVGYRQTPASDLASGTRCGQDLHTFVNSMDIRKGPSHGARKSFFIE